MQISYKKKKCNLNLIHSIIQCYKRRQKNIAKNIAEKLLFEPQINNYEAMSELHVS